MKNHTITRAVLTELATRWSSSTGFTLLELLVIVAISGILVALMAPGWVTFLNVQRLNAAQEEVLQAMYNAQSRAKQNRVPWQASFQSVNGAIQWAIHPANTTPAASLWRQLDNSIKLDDETTLQQSNGIRRLQFDHQGNINGQLGRLTLSSKMGGQAKRCIVASTLLGKLRPGKDHPTKQDGKSCY